MILLHRLSLSNFKQFRNVTLEFPEEGSFLIEGPNEAGKSSVFEAVYFALYGSALNGLTLPDLKSYGQDRMRVELQFSVDGRVFRIERSLRQNQTVRLECPAPSGEQEVIANVRGANERIVLELAMKEQGLLNTCFVEQKKLDALESLDRSARRDTINELLNLDSLTKLLKEFASRAEDTDRAQLAKKRVEIAVLDASIPEIEVALQNARSHVTLFEIRSAEKSIGDLMEESDQLEGQLEEASLKVNDVIARSNNAEKEAARLLSARTELPAMLKQWQSAVDAYSDREAAILGLEKLEAELPHRRLSLQRLAEQVVSMKRLEEAEREVISLSETLVRLRDRLVEIGHDRERQAQLTRLGEAATNSVAEAKRQLQIAEKDRLARVSLIERDRLAEELIKEHERLQSAEQAEEETKQRLTETRDVAELLPRRQADLAEVGVLLDGLIERKRLTQELRTLEENISVYERDLERVRKNDAQIEALSLRQREAEQTRSEVSANLEALERRYIDATKRSLLLELSQKLQLKSCLGDTESRRDELNSRRAEADSKKRTSEGAVQRLRRSVQLSSASAALGVVGTVASVLIPAVALMLFPGILLITFSLIFAIRTRTKLGVATNQEREAEATLNRVLGEEAGLAASLKAEEEQRGRLAADIAELSEKLLVLGVQPPVTASEAHTLGSSIDNISLENASARLDEERARFRNLDSEIKSASAMLERLVDNRSGNSSKEIELHIEVLRTREAEARSNLHAIDSPLSNNTERESNEEQLRVRQAQLSKQVADSEAAAGLLEQHELDLSRRFRDRQNKESVIHNLAEKLQLVVHTISDLVAEAIRIRAEIEQARTEVPDQHIEQNLSRQTDCLGAAERALVALDTEASGIAARVNASAETDVQSRYDETAKRLEVAQETLTSNLPVRDALKAAGLPSDYTMLSSEFAKLEERLRLDTDSVSNLPNQRQALCVATKKIGQERAAYRITWERIASSGLRSDTPKLAQIELESLQAELEIWLSGVDRPQLERELVEANQERADIVRQKGAIESQLGRHQERLQSLKASLSSDVSRLRPEKIATTSLEELEASVTEHHTRLVAARANRAQSAESLGIGPEPLDLVAERAELAEADRAIDIKRTARTIIERTREQILGRVMPTTLNNVRRLLPLITSGRYKDLEWEDSADALQVYDSSASDFRKKRVFSGGAKDQISLSLRLGFALATLPLGRATRPYWLFLDEPLSSFDKERTRALVEVLTRGLVRQHFKQIFLVSHNESFDPSLFDYRIRLEHGQIVESNLPISPEFTLLES